MTTETRILCCLRCSRPFKWEPGRWRFCDRCLESVGNDRARAESEAIGELLALHGIDGQFTELVAVCNRARLALRDGIDDREREALIEHLDVVLDGPAR